MFLHPSGTHGETAGGLFLLLSKERLYPRQAAYTLMTLLMSLTRPCHLAVITSNYFAPIMQPLGYLLIFNFITQVVTTSSMCLAKLYSSTLICPQL